MDFDQLRIKMVQEQLERRGINDPRVLAAMREIPRHLFVEPAQEAMAYEDLPLPLVSAQTISQPFMVALMTQTAALNGNEKVLEIGTGSGYQTAVLSRLAARVYSVERIETLYVRARTTLEAIGITNCHLTVGDGSQGWPEQAPYDAVIVTAAMPGIPRPLLEQLTPGGRLVAPIGDEELQSLVRVSRNGGGWREEYFGECRFVKMVGRHGFDS